MLEMKINIVQQLSANVCILIAQIGADTRAKMYISSANGILSCLLSSYDWFAEEHTFQFVL